MSLSKDETGLLLQQVPIAYGTQINDVLLTALTRVFAEWTGKSKLLLDLEGHGREELVEGLDLSHTVGWFTTVFPVTLVLERTDDLGAALRSIKEQQRVLPGRGIGYGLLRYLSDDRALVEELKALPKAEVSFNYLGQFDQGFAASDLFRSIGNLSSNRSLRQQRSHLLAIEAIITGGQLQVVWTYSRNVHQRVTIEKLAQQLIQELRFLIAHCQSQKVAAYTPSDFPDVQLSQEQLDKLLEEVDV